MRKSVLIAILIVFPLASIGATQEPALTDSEGPLPLSSAPASVNSAPASLPQPDKDGVYALGAGVLQPSITERVAVVPPDVDPAARVFGLTELSLVIDAGGHPKDIQVAHSLREPYDRAAIDAVMRTQFAPGTVEDRPVPVRVTIRVFFGRGNLPSYPHILSGSQRSLGNAPRPNALQNSAIDHPPVAIVTAMPEFSEQARAAKYQGVVVLSMLVNEEGLPEDIQIIRHLEMGLDDKAIEAARKYRFKPATKDGQPVPYRVTVEMNFRLY